MIPGGAVYGLMLTGCMYGLTILPSPIGFVWIRCSVLIGIVFARWENRQERPLISLSVFRSNRTYLYSNVAALINYAVVFAGGFRFSLSLQYNWGLDPGSTGLILLAQPLIQTIVSPLAGQFSDVIEPTDHRKCRDGVYHPRASHLANF